MLRSMAMVAPGLGQLVDRLVAGGTVSATEMPVLSDLPREDARWLRGSWASIPLGARLAILAHADELAGEHIELDFAALGKIALDDPDEAARERAIRLLWESEDTAIAERLTALAGSETAPSVLAAVAAGLQKFAELYAMGRWDAAAAAPALEALRRLATRPGQETAVRAAAVEALGPVPEPWVSAAIEAAYEDGDDALRLAALRAMGHSASDRWSSYVEEQFESVDPVFRFEAALAAGAIGDEALVPGLGALLDDAELDVVFAAIEALGEAGGDEAIALLQALREDSSEEVAEAAAVAVDVARQGGSLDPFGGSGDHDDD